MFWLMRDHGLLAPVPPGCTRPDGWLRAEDRPRSRAPARLGPGVHGAPVPGRVPLARDSLYARLTRRVRMQRHRGTLHQDIEGRMPLPPRLPKPRGGNRGVYQTLLPWVACSNGMDTRPRPVSILPHAGVIKLPSRPGNRVRLSSYLPLLCEPVLRESSAHIPAKSDPMSPERNAPWCLPDRSDETGDSTESS